MCKMNACQINMGISKSTCNKRCKVKKKNKKWHSGLKTEENHVHWIIYILNFLYAYRIKNDLLYGIRVYDSASCHDYVTHSKCHHFYLKQDKQLAWVISRGKFSWVWPSQNNVTENKGGSRINTNSQHSIDDLVLT